MKYKIKNYQEIRGILVAKRHSIFGYCRFYIRDDKGKSASIIVGKGFFSSYAVGDALTVGYIGHTLINICPGIAKSENE